MTNNSNWRTFAVDWDATCVKEVWPGHGDWLPGAFEGLQELSRLGTVLIHSTRVAPVMPDGVTWRDPEDIASEVKSMKLRLRRKGLGHVEVWTKPWKPRARVYLDDRALRFENWTKAVEDIKEILSENV